MSRVKPTDMRKPLDTSLKCNLQTVSYNKMYDYNNFIVAFYLLYRPLKTRKTHKKKLQSQDKENDTKQFEYNLLQQLGKSMNN